MNDHLFFVILYENAFRVLRITAGQFLLRQLPLLNEDLRHKLAQFPPHHLFSYENILVDLAVMHAKLVAHQLWCDSCSSFLCVNDRVLARCKGAIDFEWNDVWTC